MDIKYTNLESALKAVTANGLEIKYCSPELISNVNVLLAAIKQNYYALREIRIVRIPNTTELVINNKELMFELIKVNPKVYRDIGIKLKDDEELTYFAVSKCGDVLKDASKRLQNNKKILLAALSNSIYALDGSRIDDELKNDKDVALAILEHKHIRLNINWLGESLKQEIIKGVGFDVTKDPLNPKVIEQVKSYLKTTKNQVIKPKEEVKQEIKENTNVNNIEVKKEEKQEVNDNLDKEIKSDAGLKNDSLLQELTRLNMLKEAIQKNIAKTNELELQLNELKKEQERLKKDLNYYANDVKKIVLELKK